MAPACRPRADTGQREAYTQPYISITPEGLGTLSFPRKSRYGGRRRWRGDGHLGKEILKVPIERRRIEYIRKERVLTWHSKSRPTLGVPNQCTVDLGRHPHARYIIGLNFLPRTSGGLIYHLNLAPKLLNCIYHTMCFKEQEKGRHQGREEIVLFTLPALSLATSLSTVITPLVGSSGKRFIHRKLYSNVL